MQVCASTGLAASFLHVQTGSLALRANVTDPCGTSVRGRMKISYLSSVYFSGEDEPRYLTCLNEDKPSGEKGEAG